MQIVRGKIETAWNGATNTVPSLTKSIFSRGENRMANQTISKLCGADNCTVVSKQLWRGWCHKHYKRWKRNGDLYLVKNGRGVPFWSQVAVTANPEKCWEWQGCRDVSGYGYGVVRYNGTSYYAHRLAWILTSGFDSQLFILHSCDNPPCVNPNHLREGTHTDNMRDMIARGRAAWQRMN